jgi:hypothetical protein
MSNLPSDFSADDTRQGVSLPQSVQQTDPTASAPLAHPDPAVRPSKAPIASSEVSRPLSAANDSYKKARIEDEDDNEDEEEYDDAVLSGGIKMKDLGQGENLQFPGIKREKWWYVPKENLNY